MDHQDVTTYLLVDGENIDTTIGNSLLNNRRPKPEERPRWERVRSFVENVWDQPVTALFFINATGQLPMPFIQALLGLGYRPIPLSGGTNEKVVDIGIQRTMAAITERGGNVVLASHDGDFLDGVTSLLDAGRKVGLLGFPEFNNANYEDLRARGLEVFDIENDAGSFDIALPRIRVIPLDEFDPTSFL
ncbi:MAG: NYN domain-containing protein [Actinomycetota bacterium]